VSLDYKNPFEQSVEVQTPLSIQFINLLKVMDELMVHVDVLWFYEVIDRAQRKDASKKSYSAISDVSSMIINFNTKAHKLIKKQKNNSPEENKKSEEGAKPEIKETQEKVNKTVDTSEKVKTAA
jgi:DNA-binding transcriptional regulator GbsR (MarR family)